MRVIGAKCQWDLMSTCRYESGCNGAARAHPAGRLHDIQHSSYETTVCTFPFPIGILSDIAK